MIDYRDLLSRYVRAVFNRDCEIADPRNLVQTGIVFADEEQAALAEMVQAAYEAERASAVIPADVPDRSGPRCETAEDYATDAAIHDRPHSSAEKTFAEAELLLPPRKDKTVWVLWLRGGLYNAIWLPMDELWIIGSSFLNPRMAAKSGYTIYGRPDGEGGCHIDG